MSGGKADGLNEDSGTVEKPVIIDLHRNSLFKDNGSILNISS